MMKKGFDSRLSCRLSLFYHFRNRAQAASGPTGYNVVPIACLIMGFITAVITSADQRDLSLCKRDCVVYRSRTVQKVHRVFFK